MYHKNGTVGRSVGRGGREGLGMEREGEREKEKEREGEVCDLLCDRAPQQTVKE